jgi:hypothetical protein
MLPWQSTFVAATLHSILATCSMAEDAVVCVLLQ